jgi:trehalose 6-phosphate phosphatase
MISLDLATILAQRPLGLAFDIDGTLSPIAPTPGEAHLYPGVASLLEMAKRYAQVVIVTGRAVKDGAPIINVEGLTYIGTHGMEWCDGLPGTHPVQLIPEAEPYVEPGKHLLDLAQQRLGDLPGITVQRKMVGGSIHYRLAPDPQQARERILALLEEPARQANMRIEEGKMVIEVLTPLTINKGEALRRYVQLHSLRGVLFAGDDRTDLYAMRVLTQLRPSGISTLSVGVQHNDSLPELLELADIIVQDVKGMAELLHEIVARISHT